MPMASDRSLHCLTYELQSGFLHYQSMLVGFTNVLMRCPSYTPWAKSPVAMFASYTGYERACVLGKVMYLLISPKTDRR